MTKTDPERDELDGKIISWLAEANRFTSVRSVVMGLTERDDQWRDSGVIGKKTPPLMWKGTNREVPNKFTEINFGQRHLKESTVRSALKRLVRDGSVYERARSMNRSDGAKRRDYAVPEVAERLLAEEAIRDEKRERQREANLQLLKKAVDLLNDAGIEAVGSERSMSIKVTAPEVSE